MELRREERIAFYWLLSRKRAEQGEQDDQEKKELAKFVTGMSVDELIEKWVYFGVLDCCRSPLKQKFFSSSNHKGQSDTCMTEFLSVLFV